MSGTEPFTDVPEDAYYTKAVVWGYANGIVKGVSDTLFRPASSVTREQMATFFYRLADYSGKDVSQRADLSSFSDAASVSGYAKDTMAWAVETGLIIGVGDNRLSPRGTAIRAQVAQIVMRYLEGE